METVPVTPSNCPFPFPQELVDLYNYKVAVDPLRPSNGSFPLPQELVDLIIDCVQTLRDAYACSLVATVWTARAQRRMFQWVRLHDTFGLRSFAQALRTSPHLAEYVERLTLMGQTGGLGGGYSPDCVEVLFPTLLGSLLPNLCRLAFDVHLVTSKSGCEPVESRTEAGKTVLLPNKLRPCFPMPPRFPLLLSSFSGITELHITSSRFQTFNDFARLLCAFKQLRTLSCVDVTWITQGILLPSFMATNTNSGNTFLPHLVNLTVSLHSCRYSNVLQ